MTETSATTIWRPKGGVFLKLTDEHSYSPEQLKYLMHSAFPEMHIKQHMLGLRIYFGTTSRVDIEKLFSHFATPEARSKIYSPFTTLTVHNVLLMIDEDSLRSSIEQQFGQVIQMTPVTKPLATKYTCSRNWRVLLDQPEIPDTSPFTRNGYPERMRIQVPDTATPQRCTAFVVTFYCCKCDKDGHIERKHMESSTKDANACSSVAAEGNQSTASADKPKAPWPSAVPACTSSSKGLGSSSSFGVADVCTVEKDLVGKCNKRSSPCSSISARGKLSSVSDELLWSSLLSEVASQSQGLASDSALGATDVCEVKKGVVGKCVKRSSSYSSVAEKGKRNKAAADKSKAFWSSAINAGDITSKGLVSDFAFGMADMFTAEKDVVGKCDKKSSPKTVGLLAPPSYRPSSPRFYIGDTTASATTAEEIQETKKALPKKKGLGSRKLARIISPDDKTETPQQQVSQSIENSSAESLKKNTPKRAYRKRGSSPNVSGNNIKKLSESKYQYSETDDKEQCQNIFANMLLNLSPDSNCPRVKNPWAAKIPSISSSETSSSRTLHSSADAAASSSGQGEYYSVRKGEVVSTSGHDSGSNAKEEGSVRLTLVERYIEEVGKPLSLHELRAFIAHAKKKSNLERVLGFYTADSGAIMSQLQKVLRLYYSNTDTGTKEDKAFIKTLEGLCKRLELLEVKKTLKKEVKQEMGVKIEKISVKKEH